MAAIRTTLIADEIIVTGVNFPGREEGGLAHVGWETADHLRRHTNGAIRVIPSLPAWNHYRIQGNQYQEKPRDAGPLRADWLFLRGSHYLQSIPPANWETDGMMYGVSISESSSLSPRRVCIFCGSSFGGNPVYRNAAESFARLLAKSGIGVVYGGASVGLMGAVADAALAAGGEVIGVLPHSMMAREIGHSGLTELHLVDTLHERKAMMAEWSDAFVALPGGLGTFEEIFEVLSWAQIGLHQKPCAFLNTDGFYDGLLTFLETSVAAGFVRPESHSLIIAESDPETLLQRLREYVPPAYDRWSGGGVTP